MATNFLDYSGGSNGFLTAPFSLLTTELNTLGSGLATTSSVNGTSGVFTQSNFASGIWGQIWFSSGGTFTPGVGGVLCGWWLLYTGTAYETTVATGSTSVMALSRAPDWVIPLDNAAYSSTSIRFAPSFIKMPWLNCKVLIQNLSGAILPSSNNIITVGPVATQY